MATTDSSFLRSRPRSWARLASFQIAGSSASRTTSFRRLRLPSKSKIPPQFSGPGIEVVELIGDGVELFCFHLGCPIRVAWLRSARILTDVAALHGTHANGNCRSHDRAQQPGDHPSLPGVLRLPVVQHQLHRALAVVLVDLHTVDRRCAREEAVSCPNRMASSALGARARRRSFRWRPPTIRCSATSNSSKNAGAANPWPQTCASSASANGRLMSAVASGPSVSITRSRSAGVEQVAHGLFEGFAECGDIRAAHGQSRRRGVPAEAQDQAGMALGDQIERIAQVQSGVWSGPNPSPPRRLPGANAITGRWKRLPQACRQDADHALMPGFVVQAQAVGIGGVRLRPSGPARFPACRPRCPGARD